MRMSDADFDAIIARANDKRAWMKPVASPRLLADWEATRQAVLAANGDKKQIAQALTNFVGTDGHKRAAAIEGTVRRPLTGKGGTRYEWPDSLSKHKGAFDEIVFGDPLSSPQAKARAGQYKEAIDELNASIHKLAQVYGPLMGGASEFKDPAVHAEMISQINRVEGEMKAEVKIITNKMSRPAAAKADPKAAAAKPDPAAEEAERQKEAAERERLQAESWCSQVGYTFMNNKQREMQLFNEIDAEYNKKALGFIPVKADVIVLIGKINQIKEMHVQWHATIGQYKEKCAKYGWQPVLGGDREPNTAKKDEYYARINRW